MKFSDIKTDKWEKMKYRIVKENNSKYYLQYKNFLFWDYLYEVNLGLDTLEEAELKLKNHLKDTDKGFEVIKMYDRNGNEIT